MVKDKIKLSFNSYSRRSFFTDTDFGFGNNSKSFIEDFRLIHLEKREDGRRRMFNAWRFNFDKDNSRVRADGETEDIAKVVIKGNQNAIFFNAEADNFLVAEPGKIPLQDAIYLIAGIPQSFYGSNEETFISKEFHLGGSFLQEDIFVFDNPYRIMNSRLNIFPAKLGIAIGEDSFNSIARFNKFQDHIYRYPGSFDAGFSKAGFWVNAYSVFVHSFLTPFLKKDNIFVYPSQGKVTF